MMFRKAIEGPHALPVAAQRLNRLGAELAIAGGELIAQPLAFSPACGVGNLAQQFLRRGPLLLGQMIDHVGEPMIPAALLRAVWEGGCRKFRVCEPYNEA